MDVVQSLHPSAVHLGISGKTTRQTGTWNADEQYQLAYSQEEATAVVLNGQRALTLNNTVPTWPKCLACAMNDRAYTSDGSARSQECQECFDTWCWDGTDDTSTPSGDYAPVVGTVPKFLSDKGLVDASKTQNNAATSSAPAAASSTGAAGSVRMGKKGWGGVGVGVGAVLGAMVGGMTLLV